MTFSISIIIIIIIIVNRNHNKNERNKIFTYHETSFGCGDGENGRCNIGPLFCGTILIMPPFKLCDNAACVAISEFNLFGELTRILSGDNCVADDRSVVGVSGAAWGGVGRCGWGLRTVGCTGICDKLTGGECVFIGGELSPKR